MAPKKQAFTLLEMLLVIALCTLTAGTGIYSLANALYHERFEKGVTQLAAKIMLAQELALDYRMDVELTITQETPGLRCRLTTGRPLEAEIKKKINQKDRIEILEEVAFNGVSTHALVLHFDGSLGTTPKGTLSVSDQRGKEAYLALKGFPTMITRGEYEDYHAAARYPETLLSAR